MNILITGGTGLLGAALIRLLRFDNEVHKLTVFTRNYAKACRNLHASIMVIDSFDEVNLKDFDAIINLAGEPIVDKKWTDERKKQIMRSRFDTTKALVAKINSECSADKKIQLISASAVGIYGPQGTEPIDETFSSFGNDFGSKLCQQWEQIASTAKHANVTLLRTGIVLSNQGGALEKIIPPFWTGFGGKISNGKQYMPWIHIKDWASAVKFILENKSISGPINLSAPNPVSNKEFTQALATVLHRPAFVRVPRFVLRLILGERADLIIFGQNAVPTKLLDNKFEFKFPILADALDDLLLL